MISTAANRSSGHARGSPATKRAPFDRQLSLVFWCVACLFVTSWVASMQAGYWIAADSNRLARDRGIEPTLGPVEALFDSSIGVGLLAAAGAVSIALALSVTLGTRSDRRWIPIVSLATIGVGGSMFALWLVFAGSVSQLLHMAASLPGR